MKYYYSDGTKKFGPMTPEKVAEMAAANPGGRNYVWKPGLEEWVVPGELEEIRVLLETLRNQEPTDNPGIDGTASPSGETAAHEPHQWTMPSTSTPQQKAGTMADQNMRQAAAADQGEKQLSSSNNVQFVAYPKGNIGKRLGAWAIDTLISMVFLIPSIIIMVAAFNEPRLTAPLLILSVMLVFPSFIYTFIRDGLGQGQSWGKQLVGLMVVDIKTNEPCTKGKSFIRNIVAFLLALFPFVGWLVEPIIVLADDKGRRLGDRAADTMVIQLNDYSGDVRSTLRA